MANRAELEKAVQEGSAVEVTGWPHPVRGAKAWKDCCAQFGDEDFEGVVIRDAQGRLTRQGMESHIKAGGSVMYGDSQITKLEDLPHPAELAKGDQKKLAAVESDIDRRQALLDADRARVATAKKQADERAKSVVTDDDNISEEFSHLSADELHALCEKHKCVPEGRATKAKMAEALTAKGVKPKG